MPMKKIDVAAIEAAVLGEPRVFRRGPPAHSTHSTAVALRAAREGLRAPLER